MKSIYLVSLFTLIFSVLAFAEDTPIILLFAGSSSTYFNDMPREVAKVVDGKMANHVGTAVLPEIVGRSGSDIRVYMEPGFNKYEYGVKPGQSFLDKIREEKPPFVVLQTVCRFIMGDDDPTGTGNAHADAVKKYCEAIRAVGGEPVFNEMGWGKTEREAEGRQRAGEIGALQRGAALAEHLLEVGLGRGLFHVAGEGPGWQRERGNHQRSRQAGQGESNGHRGQAQSVLSVV